ncbi:nitrate reductase [Shewanella submarina]|uniref:Molybdopterin-dependent oxidoreductase n=1 Tax=Shewanella submarina TaxID=2016376 RepID=A0ABV7GHU1_9GAMM|nr:nitrate reductase [Shewanella submarina]MCL1035964.1 nitrate reductase [Shewanella submarina]
MSKARTGNNEMQISQVAAPHSGNGENWTKSTCAYCGVGCGIEARVAADGELMVRGDETHPANYGRLCSKGMALGETLSTTGRMLSPSVHGQACDWQQALDTVASSLNQVIAEHGPDAVAFYVSGQLLIEDYYVANKLMKGFIGSGNIDTNSRLCMASAVAGHKRAFGEDCVPGNYGDLEMADLVVLVGSNLAWCHPVLFARLKAAKEQRGTRVVVIDPRVTASCDIADLHLAIKPGTDVALFNGLLTYLHGQGLVDQDYIAEHTKAFDKAVEAAAEFAPISKLSEVTGLNEEDINTLFHWFGETHRTVTLFSQGVNQSSSGTDKVNSILNCHLATGRIGQPGSSPFSITGQPNAMGGREVGAMANTLAAHLEFGRDDHHCLLSDYWGCSELATSPGLKAVDMFDAIEQGQIKAIWIMATNPAVSLPDSERINSILADCPLVIVSDVVADNDTLKHADICLPAQGWSEKSGTVSNSERCLSRQRRLLPTPGEGKPDWWIISEVAKRMGFASAFDYASELEIFNEYVALTAIANSRESSLKRQLNLGGLGQLTPTEYQHFKPTQWPVSGCSEPSRLYADGRFSTQDGRGRFVAVYYQVPALSPDNKFPLMLNSGRLRDQWHTMTRTGLSTRLNSQDFQPLLVLNPEDARSKAIEEGDLVKVASQLASQIFVASLSNQISRGQCFAPIHWSKSHCSSAKVSSLIPAFTDPVSGQPEFKATPVDISLVATQSRVSILVQQALPLFVLEQLEPVFWVKQRVANGYLYHLEYEDEVQPVVHKLSQLLEANGLMLSGRETLVSEPSDEYRRVIHRVVLFDAIAQANDAFAQANDGLAIQPQSHLKSQPETKPLFSLGTLAWEVRDKRVAAGDIATLVKQDFPLELVHAFLAGKLAQRPSMVCACKQVSKAQVQQVISAQNIQTVAELGQITQAGTGCGTCKSELSQLLRECQLRCQQA